MGRHSIPDPEESADRPPEDAGDATESFAQQPQVPPSEYTGYRVRPPEPDHPDYGGTEYDADYDADFEEPAYQRPSHPEPPYREPEYQEAEYDSDYDDEYDDKYEADYSEPEYGGVPEYLQPGYREPEDAEPGFRPATETPSYAAAAPPPRPPSRAQHSGEWEGGEWTGSHRAIQTGRRGVSLGVIGALVAVVVVVAAFILWRFFGDALSNRSTIASARCVDGQQAVAVVADPSIADQISTLAKKYNETANPVGDKCVDIDVKPADSDQVVNGFIGSWPAELGDRPALWIPGQLGVAGPARGRRGRGNRQRQPLAGQLAGGACHPTAAQRRSCTAELGNAAGPAEQSDFAERVEPSRLGFATARTSAQR